ncbi:MAG: FAD-dependent oxidoreductase [Alphaproteobacteria bacterium]
MALDHLFSPLQVGPVEIRNRIFSTAHMTMLARERKPTDELVAYHEARARGGAGLVIVESASVHWSGNPILIKLYSDDCIPGYARIAEAVHAHGCTMFIQMGHQGRENIGSQDGSLPVAYAPSGAPNERFHVMPRVLNREMIADIVAGYGAAAARVVKTGADGIELSASQGYLLSQFLNPRVNQRDDDYGGSLENRLRLHREIIAAVRTSVGRDLVVGMRISGDELEHDGLTPGESLEAAMLLDSDGGLDYFNVITGSSTGLAGSVHIVPPMAIEAGYGAPYAAAIREKVSIPIFVAGRINQPQIAENIVASGQAHMCGMTRAMICDPDMGNKARDGRLDDVRACIACNQACIGHMWSGFPVSCIQNPVTGRETQYGTIEPAAKPRKVLVAGGGPGGMKAAAMAAQRGHQVTLYEKESRLGGQALLARMLPGRAEFGGIVTNLEREMELAGVEVVKSTEVTAALIAAQAPDAIVVATGATVRRPAIEGAEEAHVVDAWQVIRDEANVGQRVVIADWRCDWVGMGLAEKLARDGCAVTLAVNGNMAGQSIQQYVRDRWVGELHKLGVTVITYARLGAVDADTVYLEHTTSGEPILCEGVDTLVTALGHEPVTGLEHELSGYKGEVHIIGDCLSPRTAEEAVLEGFKVALAI